MTDGHPEQDDRVEHRLRDLLEFAKDAEYTVGLSLETYMEDSPHGRVLRNNGRHILIQVATVVEKLPTGFKDAYADVDWIAIARMRNLIAHHYDKVEDRLVFSALSGRIPDLISRLGL